MTHEQIASKQGSTVLKVSAVPPAFARGAGQERTRVATECVGRGCNLSSPHLSDRAANRPGEHGLLEGQADGAGPTAPPR